MSRQFDKDYMRETIDLLSQMAEHESKSRKESVRYSIPIRKSKLELQKSGLDFRQSFEPRKSTELEPRKSTALELQKSIAFEPKQYNLETRKSAFEPRKSGLEAKKSGLEIRKSAIESTNSFANKENTLQIPPKLTAVSSRKPSIFSAKNSTALMLKNVIEKHMKILKFFLF